jgi:hypothetical protein
VRRRRRAPLLRAEERVRRRSPGCLLTRAQAPPCCDTASAHALAAYGGHKLAAYGGHKPAACGGHKPAAYGGHKLAAYGGQKPAAYGARGAHSRALGPPPGMRWTQGSESLVAAAHETDAGAGLEKSLIMHVATRRRHREALLRSKSPVRRGISALNPLPSIQQRSCMDFPSVICR